MINISPNLKKAVRTVGRQAVRTNAAKAIQAEDVFLVLLHRLVDETWVKELLSKKSFKPVGK